MRSVDGAELIEAVEAHGSSRSVRASERASAITQCHLHWIPLVLKLLALLLPDGAKLEIECRSIDSLDPAFCVGSLCFVLTHRGAVRHVSVTERFRSTASAQ